MANEKAIAEQFWKALKADRTIMLSLVGVDDGASRPMTANLESEEQGPIWIFTSKDTRLVQSMGQRHAAIAHFASQDHELFASVTGNVFPDNNRVVIDRLWNTHVAAWYEGGRGDPKLQLVRFEPERAHIWLNETSLFAGIKMLLGRDPKEDYRDKVAEVRLQ
ncbi:MAG: pyridoxamine 5'-phosphate oxidase family protein [Micropepsaceae bacterium]